MTRPHIVAATFVTLVTLLALAVTSAVSKTPRGQSPPANTTTPTISGTAAVGSALQASTGSWQGRSISYSFQWQRCSSDGCAAISGGTGSSYLVGSADAGYSLRVAVTATNKFGSTVANSAPTAVVPSQSSGSSGYTNTTLPAISGTAQAGQTLTVSNGSWSPTSSSFQYAWHRCQNGSCALSPTNANQASYSVQPGDAGYTIFAEVAPGGEWSQSANSKPTATVTTAPSTSGTVAFDGGANGMTTLYSYETTAGDISTLQQGQSPNLWTCLCFNNNTMSLVADSRYGKVYKNVVGPGDKNPWNSAAPATNAAGQVSKRRDNNLGKWDWYAIAVKIPSTWQRPPWTSLVSLGYETLASDQVALGVKTTSSGTYFTIHQNSGLVAKTSTGFYAGSVSYDATVVPVTYDTWQELVIGVKWATDNTGAVELYTRTPGSSWQHPFEKLNVPTYAYGTTSYGTIDANLSQAPTVLDKIGLYYGGYSSTSFPTETVYESGLTRSSNLTTAQSTLP